MTDQAKVDKFVDFLLGTTRKIPGLDEHIDKMQMYFDEDVALMKEAQRKFKRFDWTLKLIKLYRGNPDQFEFLISDAVWTAYNFDAGEKDFGYIWAACENMVSDIIWEKRNFKIFHTGIFSGIDFSDTKRAKFEAEFEKHMLELSEEKEWCI
jgi:hypothetical protein